MFGCAITLHIRHEKKAELLQRMSQQLVPALNQTAGAHELVVLQDDIELDRFLILTLWDTREDAERYRATGYEMTKSVLEPYLTLPPMVRTYKVDDTVPRSLGIPTAEQMPRAS
jgi:quinol monooxygenase YgiN